MRIKIKSAIITLTLILVIFLFNCHSIFAQEQISFRQLSVKEGLSQNSAISIAQDSIGFLWIATQDGLNKYDGREFSYYPFNFTDITKPDYSNLGKVYTDREKSLWIIPTNKIPYKFNPLINQFEPITGVNDASIIFQDEQLNVWIGTYSSGLYLLNSEILEARQVLSADQINAVTFHIAQKNESEIILAAGKNILEINTKTYRQNFITPKTVSGQPIDANISAIIFEKSGSHWISTYGKGLYYKDPSDEYYHRISEQLFTKKLPNDLNILALYKDKKDRLWVATYGDGLYKIDFNSNTITHFEVEKHNLKSLHYNDILCIYEDYSGTLWFGSDGAGVSYYDEYLEKFNAYTNYQTPDGISIDLVRAIAVEKNGITWIGTSGKGLTKFDPKSNIWRTFLPNQQQKNSISSDRIVSLLVDNANDLWIGTQEGGLNILNSKNSFTKYFETSDITLSAKTIWCIFKDRNNKYWLGTRDNGLIQFDKNIGEIKKYNKQNALTSNNIRVITEDSKKNLWIGTESSGIGKFDIENETFTSFMHKNDKNSLSNDNIKSLYLDSNEILWIGTNGGGLNAFDIKNDKFYHFTTKDGLANDVIYAILPDENKNLWLSSNKGITRFTPPRNFEEKPIITNYTNYDGLGSEFNTGAFFKRENGDLYFGALEGFYMFNPNSIVDNTILPKTAIIKFEVFNELFPLQNNIILKASQNTISFTFSSLQFSLPQKNQFQYKLTNIDEDWVASGNKNYARYTNLPAGDYTFLVKSSNYDGVWNDNPKSFSFKILQPWYSSVFAIIAYIYLGLTLIYLTYLYFKWRWKMQLELKLKKEETIRLKELDEHKNKLYANISHEFRTPLTLITAPLKKQLQSKSLPKETKSDLQLIDRNTTQLMHLFDQLLELSKLESSSVKLQVRQGNLDALLKAICTSFSLLAKEKKLKLTTSISSIENIWFSSDIIEKIMNNLLSNALKYTSENGEILFTANLIENGELELIFINDIAEIKEKDISRIFERFYQIDSDSEGSGIGLSLVKELVHLAHGTIEATIINSKKIKFLIKLPTRKDAFQIDEIDQKIRINNHQLQDDLFDKESLYNPKAPIALIVDDNKDMRKFIKSLLVNEFKVVEASDGKIGIEKALKIIPDIIISDIMMPVKSGIELCSMLKEDERTSHIPIILLTAKTGEENEITGLNTGADDYITKPFSSRKLLVKVKTLIELRQKLRFRYRQDVFLQPKEIATTNTDEKFFKRVDRIMEDHLTDPDFNAENFSNLIGMSRMQLHRKLIALTNLSATAFIRSQRLKLAVKILKTSDANVSEAAYSSGFNTSSYFIKCFKEVYKKTPAEYFSQ